MSKFTKTKELLLDALSEIDSQERFEGEETLTFVRVVYNNPLYPNNFSTWKVLLDEIKTKICAKDAQGYKLIGKTQSYQIQTVISTIGTRDLLLSKNKQDREVAKVILDSLATIKYKI